MATVTEITQVLGQVQQLSAGMLEELEKGTAEVGVFSIKAQQLGKVITSISGMVPMTIYSNYQEFFDSFKDFCGKCKEEDFLIENVDNMASSLDLFGECMGAMAEECVKKIKTCACCGKEVVYKPLPTYWEEMKKQSGDYKEANSETLNKEEYLCPVCGSSDRDRMIVSFLKELEIDKAVAGEKLLQVAPARTIEQYIQGNCVSLTYHSTDLFMDGVTFRSDIQDMNQVEDGCYDYFICSHVLEHVEDDRKAMRELHRVLKDDGVGLFLVPLDLNVQQTDEEWGLSEEENWRRFGQGDHCRKYAKKDLLNRLKETGFHVHELGKEYFGEEVFHQCGLTDTSTLYVLTKEEGSIQEFIMAKKKNRETFVPEQPLVSVILPTYNHVEYIEEAIESVLNQTYPNIEILVADDGSTDGTSNKIRQFEDKLAEMHLFETNRGGGLGIFLAKMAKGKYIAMMHSDDVWAPNKIEMQVAYMESHPECGACFTGCRCMEEDGNTHKTQMFPAFNMSKEERLRKFYECGNHLAHPSVMALREPYTKAVGGGTLRFRQVPDLYMWIQMVQKYDIHVLNQELTYFRFHEGGEKGNTSSRTVQNWLRNLVEESFIWYETFRDMEDDFFVKAFKDRMVDKEATTHNEILCEKLFVLLEPRTHYLKQSGIFFMYDIYKDPEIMELLREKYKWGRPEIAQITGEFLVYEKSNL